MATRTRIELDETNQVVTIRRMDDTDGSDAPTYAKISLDLTGLETLVEAESFSGDIEAKWRVLHFKDADDDCAPKKLIYFGLGAIDA
jgi:hypothetical protein